MTITGSKSTKINIFDDIAIIDISICEDTDIVKHFCPRG